ncbi:MAG: UDP-N-acetylglucosamine 1-carboxyvinyltransferase [Firmicutes bacterium]|nr:UDP-N-acetylglucosamine 1-carboxyvinyltransferase [Bacillota bacterium]
MQKLIINGPCGVKGETYIQGAKNSVLPILAATILVKGESIIKNCPDILDVHTSLEILNYLGCKTNFTNFTITVNSENISKHDIPEFLMRKMRSSIIFLGALISRTGHAKLTLPGGCELGPRPIDMHISSLRQLGVFIEESHGEINCKIKRKLVGTNITLTFPSVGTTENIMLAAASCAGQTIINNAAREPEIVDLAAFMNKLGAKIYGAGGNQIIIDGSQKFTQTEHTIIPDRIVATTLMATAAATGSSIILKKIDPSLLYSSISIFEEAGCYIQIIDKNILKITSPEKLQSVKKIRTMPYPGFPTDNQAPVMAMLATAYGTSIFVETIFESRFKHICELSRLGAKIKTEGNVAIVEGTSKLSGANVKATDLRGAAALLVAGLAAEGQTTISDLEHFLRGYEWNKIQPILSSNVKYL